MLFDPEVWPKYQEHVQVAHAIYVDYICNLLPHRLHTSNLSQDGRARHAEFNVYHSLNTSDRYVWLYGEYLDWYEDVRVPPHLEDAIRSAKRKLARGEPLGFTITDELSASNQQTWADRGGFEARTAKIPRLKGKAPVIDGKLDDAAWQQASELGPFVAYVEAPEYDLAADVSARVLYDSDHLYVAFVCREPDMKATRTGTDETFDDVSVILAPEGDRQAWRVFGVGADGKGKDAHLDGEEAVWSPVYRRAVELGEDEWTVEFAIPWKALGMAAPESGETLAANLAHMRVRRRSAEYTTWSKFVGKRDSRPSYNRVEPEKLGTWLFE